MAKYQARGGGLMRVVFSLLVIAAILSAAEACDPGDPMPMPDGGMTSSSSSSSSGETSSSSSSSSGQMGCVVEYVATVCDECKALGCPMADPKDPDKCHYVGTVHYTDQIGCIQLIPGACPKTCPDNPMPGDIITPECSECVRKYTMCSMDCLTEASGGK